MSNANSPVDNKIKAVTPNLPVFNRPVRDRTYEHGGKILSDECQPLSTYNYRQLGK